MESKKRQARKPNPRTDANIFSKLTFWYNKELFKTSFRKELDEEDLYDVTPDFETSTLGDRMEEEWKLHRKQKNAMFLVFWNIFGKYYSLLFLTTFIDIALNVIRPVLLGMLVSYFSPKQTALTKTDAFFYGSLLILLQIIQVIWMHNYHFFVESLTIIVRTAISSLIYRKILKFPASRLRSISFGKITNLITKDINVFDRSFKNFSQACSGVIATIITCYNMYQKIRFPAIVAAVAFALFSIFQVCMGAWTARIRRLSLNKADSRITLLQTALSNIRCIKMFVSENSTERKISAARTEEILVLLKMFKVLITTVVTAIIVHSLTFYLVVLSSIWFGHTLTAETIYYFNGAFIGLQYNMVTTLPYGSFYTSQAIAAIKRMQELILKLEIQIKRTPNISTCSPRIEFQKVELILDQTNLKASGTITTGLTLVTGSAGSGKSVFLLAILKEFDLARGELITKGRISYSSQEPWLFPSTIKQNIIFGSDYKEDRYRKVVKVCALEYDFARLENGDETVVADNGINLSRGQQSRINLARAIYKESEIYLLDDCLSSVDPIVSNYIFINCFLNYLKDKVVLLITHNTDLIPYATCVLNITNGNVNFCENKFKLACTKIVEDTTAENISKLQLKEEKEENSNPEGKLLYPKKENTIYAEEKQKGAVSCQIFKAYVCLGGGFTFCFTILAVFIATQLFLSYKDKLISDWADLEDRISQFNETKPNDVLSSERKSFFYKYTFAVITLSLCTLIRAWMLFIFSKRVSINLHAKMLKSVFNAVLKFFDTTFIGNIVNRFSKDLIVVDEDIPFFLLHFTAIMCETMGNLVLIFSTNIKLVVPIALLLITIFFLRFAYLKNGRALKRLDAITKSPVIGYLNSTIEGLATIKVFNAETILQKEFERRHNLYNSATFSYMSCLKAFVFLVDISALIFIAILILQFIIFDQGVSSGEVGLAVSQAFIMTRELFYAVYMEADIQTQMTSVERALEYTYTEHESKGGLVLQCWPKEPEIRYTNVSFSVNLSRSYILRNIYFVIKPREKIGIVGRTGAGKSSIISALFRLYETSGKITIDGVDIKTLSLNFLRSKISVVPQDPKFLDGSLRDNIDPNKKYSDEDIWSGLEKIHLKTVISDLSVSMKKLNLSSGEKQLFCLAKILLSDNKILVIDEMVENVDLKTEELISQVIDQNFASATVIKIAHKLRFVMNCDKILVLDRGKAIEFDNPKVLLANQNSIFYDMVQSSGNNYVEN